MPDTDVIEYIEGVIRYADGKKVEFLIHPEGTSRWGEVTEVLGRAVEPCEIMHAALAEANFIGKED